MSVDQGLQPERTSLAWRRTALALVVGSLLALRILSSRAGGWALLPAVLGTAMALAVLVLSHRRYERQRRQIEGGQAADGSSGGGLAALTAAAACALGLVGLVGLILVW